MLRLEWVTDAERFLALRDAWNELVEASDADHACMRHEWFAAWIQRLGRAGELHAAALWSDGLLVGAAPTRIALRSLRGIPFRLLMFLASGSSPRCNFLARDEAAARALFDAVLGSRRWDLVWTENQAADQTDTQRYLGHLNEKGGGRAFHDVSRRSPYIERGVGWDAYWASRSKGFKQSLRTAVNRLAERPHTIETITRAPDLERAFPQLLETSKRSWKGNVQGDLGSEPGAGDFLLDVANRGEGLFELRILRIEGAVAAFDYYLKGRGRWTLVRTDFDPEFKFYSPGNVLRYLTLQELLSAQEPPEYDLGGQDYGYKMKWADRVREHRTVVAAAGSPKGRAAVLAWRLARNFRSKRGTKPAKEPGAA